MTYATGKCDRCGGASYWVMRNGQVFCLDCRAEWVAFVAWRDLIRDFIAGRKLHSIFESGEVMKHPTRIGL